MVATIAEQREFDYFALDVQWPPIYCSNATKCCYQSVCCRGFLESLETANGTTIIKHRSFATNITASRRSFITRNGCIVAMNSLGDDCFSIGLRGMQSYRLRSSKKHKY